MKKLPMTVGIIWYKSKEDFTKSRSIFKDAFLLPDTYEEFVIQATGIIQQIEATGRTVIKAELNPEIFPTWCKARGLNIDANGRTAFANEAAFNFMKEREKT